MKEIVLLTCASLSLAVLSAQAQFTFTNNAALLPNNGILYGSQTYDGYGVDSGLGPITPGLGLVIGTNTAVVEIGTGGTNGSLTVKSGTLSIFCNDFKVALGATAAAGPSYLNVGTGATLNVFMTNLWSPSIGRLNNSSAYLNISNNATVNFLLDGANEQRFVVGDANAITAPSYLTLNGGTLNVTLNPNVALGDAYRQGVLGGGANAGLNGQAIVALNSGTFNFSMPLPLVLGGSYGANMNTANPTVTSSTQQSQLVIVNGNLVMNQACTNFTSGYLKGAAAFTIGNGIVNFIPGGKGTLSLTNWTASDFGGSEVQGTGIGTQIYTNGVLVNLTVSRGSIVNPGFTYLTVNGMGILSNTLPAAVPDIAVQPANASANPGQMTNFSVTAYASTAINYQWQGSNATSGAWANVANGAQTDGSTAFGATTSTLVLSNLTLATSRNYYRVIATDTPGSTTSSVVRVSVVAIPPTIVAPAGGTVNIAQQTNLVAVAGTDLVYPGTTVFLSITATGNPAPAYQWQAGPPSGAGPYTNLINGTVFSGVTNATLVISNFSANQVANYFCVVTNIAGSVTNTGLNGNVASFNLALDPNLLYNWSLELPGAAKVTTGFSTVPGWMNQVPSYTANNSGVQKPVAPDLAPVSGAWDAYLQSSDYGPYQITPTKVTAAGTIYQLTWYASAGFPYSGLSTNEYQTVEILTAVSSNTPFASTVTNIIATSQISPVFPGSWNESILYYQSTAADVGKYIGVAFDSSVTNSKAVTGYYSEYDNFTLTVRSASAAPAIAPSSEPTNQEPGVGATVYLSAYAVGNGLSYQWKVSNSSSGTWTNLSNGAQGDGSTISGATSATMIITNFHTGSYYEVVVSSPYGTATSSPAQLTSYPGAPLITTAPVSQSVYVGQPVTFTVVAQGVATYQWESSPDGFTWSPISNGANVSGANTATLSIAHAQLTNGQLDYAVFVYNGYNGGSENDTTISPANLYVSDQPPMVVQNTTNSTGNYFAQAWSGVPTNFTFGAAIIGDYPLTLQWQFSPNYNGAPSNNVPGATSSTLSLVLTNPTVAQSGYYSLQGSNSLGTVNSSWMQLQVTAVTYAWQTPVPMAGLTAAQILGGPPGTWFEAEDADGTNTVVINGTDYGFDGSQSFVTVSGANGSPGSGAAFGGTGNATLDTIFNAYFYDAPAGGTTHFIYINNLTVGTVYSVQLFAIDDRAGENVRTVNYQDPNNVYDTSATITEGNNDYELATFTATSSSMEIQENLLGAGNTGNTTAVIVRTIGGQTASPLNNPLSAPSVTSSSSTITGTGGSPNGAYVLWGTTNLVSTPWISINTNNSDGSGNISESDSYWWNNNIQPPQVFYIIVPEGDTPTSP